MKYTVWYFHPQIVIGDTSPDSSGWFCLLAEYVKARATTGLIINDYRLSSPSALLNIGDYGSVIAPFQFWGSSSVILLEGNVGITVSTYFNQSYALTSCCLHVANKE